MSKQKLKVKKKVSYKFGYNDKDLSLKSLQYLGSMYGRPAIGNEAAKEVIEHLQKKVDRLEKIEFTRKLNNI